MAPRTDLWLQNLLDERDGAALYEGLARHERDPARADSFRELAVAERRHAELWQRKLEREGVPIPPDRPSSRVRAIVWLARRLGSAAVVPMVLETEAGDADKYERQGGEAREIAEEERAHRRALAGMSEAAVGRHELVAFAPTSLRGPGRIRAALEGIPADRRLIPLPVSHALRTGWSRLGHPAVERLAGQLGAFLFSEWMYPAQRRGVRATVDTMDSRRSAPRRLAQAPSPGAPFSG